MTLNHMHGHFVDYRQTLINGL